MKRIAVFDYGAGNLHSIVKAISADDRDISVEADLRSAMKADVLVLPGVGAFSSATDAMRSAQPELRSALLDGAPCIGICLGMQLLFDSSEEGVGDGIGLIQGKAARLRTSRVPHIGWNNIDWTETANGQDSPDLRMAYFANSYVCEAEDESGILAWTTHQDQRFPAVVRRANTVGVQFHPEKSSFAGRAFVNLLIEELVECR